MKKRFYSFLILLAALFLSSNVVWGQTLPIGSADSQQAYAPLYNTWADSYFISQIIYSSTELSALNGKQITKIKFTLASKYDRGDAKRIQVRFKEVSYNAFAGTSYESIEGATLVQTGNWPTSSSTTIELTLSEPYVYEGGNLLIDVRKVDKVSGDGYASSSKGKFRATYGSSYNVLYNYSGSALPTSGTRSMTRPDITFTYEDAAAASCPKPTISSAVATSTSTATISWTAGGEETAWNMQYKGAGDADWTSVDLTTSNTTIDAGVRSYSLTGLTENTAYQVKLKAVCGVGDESAEVSSSFKTPCTPIASLTCGFEASEGYVNGTYPDCWAKISSTAYPQVYNYSAATGSQVLRFYQAGPQYAILPLFNQDVKNLEISFYYRNYSYSETLQVGYMTDPADASTFVALPTAESTLPYITSYNAEKTEISLSGAAVGARYIAFKYNCTSNWGASYVDDISVSVSVSSSCAKPTGLSAVAASATSLDLDWTAKGEETAWQVQYRVGSGSWSSPVNATTNPFTLTGLTAQTTYEIQVRANCGGEQSDWSASAEATTLCDAQPIPWSEDFEGMSNGTSSSPAPDCWAYLGLNSGSYPYAYPSAYNDGTKYYKGTRALFLVSSSSADSYMILPEFDAPLNSLQLTFSHFEEAVAKSGTLVVGYMTDITNASSFVAIDGGACTNANKTWTDEEISLASVPAGVASTARLVIKFTHSSSSNYYSAIDDITVSELPACPKPVLTATNVIYNGATINWADGSSENKWKLQYKATSDADWTDANGGALIAASSFALTGLTPGTAYQVHAQAECEGDWSNAVSFTPNYVAPTDFQLDAKTANNATISWTANSGESAWTVQYKKSSDADWTTLTGVTANPYTITGLTSATTYQVRVAAGTLYTSAITFDTECENVTTFPWEENFESRTENTIVKCWDNSASTASGNDYYKWGVHSSGGNKMMRMCNYFVGQTYGTAIINTPSIEIPSDGKEYELKFDYCHTATCGNFSIKISTDNGESFSSIAGASYPNGSSSTSYTDPDKFTTATVSLAGYNGQTIILQFFTYADWSNGAIFVDNITIAEKPACANPTELTVSNITASSATITWASEASGFALQYKKGAGEWQDATGTITSPYILSSLDEQSTYMVQVKAICSVGNESEFVASEAFTTNCAEKTLGYEMAFDATLDACWDNSVYGFSSQWNISNEGTNYYMRYATNTNASCYGVLETPAIAVPADKETIVRFRWQNTGASASLQVSVDGAAPEDVATDLGNTTSGWATKDISLSDYKGHTVVFYLRGAYNTAKNKYLYLDDFSVIEKPCDTPTELAAAVTSNGATVTWTAGSDESQWNLQYREITEPESSWTLVENVTSGYTITGIIADHNYEAQVQAYCDETHQSPWTASVNFTPVCGAAPTNLAVSACTINSATLTWESAESAFVLQTSLDNENWESPINVNAKTFNLTGLAAGTTYYARVQNACGGEYASASFTTWCGLKDAAELPLEINNFTAVPECWQIAFVGEYSGIANGKIFFYGDAEQMAVLPAYDIELNKLSVTFSFTPSATNLEFGYIDEPNGVFHAFASQPASGVELNLEDEAAAAKYIAIRYHDGGANTSASITGVQLRKTPTCLKPTDVTVVEDVDQATVSWTSTATAWNLQYKPASAAAWQDATGTITNPFTLTGLVQGNTYKVRVQSACAGDELSDWSDEVSFTTACSSIASLPWDADFSGSALSSCWTIHCESPEWYSPTVFDGLQLPGGKTGQSNIVVLPRFSADFANATITLRYQCVAGANYATPLIGYVTDKDDPTTFAVLKDAEENEIGQLQKSSSYKTVYLPLNALPANVNLAIKYADGTSEGNLFIKEFRISRVEIFEDINTNNTTRLNDLKSAGPIDVVLERPILRNGDYNTLCLPFDLSAAQMADSKCPLNGFEVREYDHSDVDINNDIVDIYLQTVSEIEAGKACFVRLQNGTLENLTMADFRDVTITTTDITSTDDNASGIHYIGVFDPHTLIGHDPKNLYLSNNSKLYYPSTDAVMKGFRAYFSVDEDGPAHAPIARGAKVRISEPNNAPTAVDNVQNNAQSIKVLENNHVVIIRNGVKYTVQGQKIQ